LDDDLDLAAGAVALALEAGAGDAEATFAIAKRFSCEARDGTLAKLEQSVGRSLTLRVYVRGAKATLSTTDLSAAGIRAAAGSVVDAAGFVAPDPYAGLSDEAAGGDSPDLGIFDEAIGAREPALKVGEALELERLIRAFDPRITNSGGSRVSDTVSRVAYANSRGSRGAYRGTAAARSTVPIALDGEVKRNAPYGSAGRALAAIDGVERVATLAAQRAIAQCGARKPAGMKVPVIFDRDIAAAVLGDVFAGITASGVATGNSFLIGKVGERIGSELVTIVDDGRLRGGLGTSPFDAEGTPTRRTAVFERGVLRTYLYDSYYARKLGAATTGNAAGGGIGPNNFYLEQGAGSLEDLIAATPRGVLITETIGFATETATGTYSRGARGFLIEGGALAYPIDGFTIAGNLIGMLGAIDAVAGDLRFDSSIVSPSFRVAEMTVA
jgi:PmbA protein